MPTPTCRAPAITLAAATRWLRGLLTAWIRADLYVALAVTALGGYAAGALGVAQDLGASGALFFGTLLIYSLDHGRDAREAETRSGWRSGAGRSDGRRAVTGRLPFAALAGVRGLLT